MDTKQNNRKKRAESKDVEGIIYKIYCKTTKKYYIGQTLSHKFSKARNQWDASGIKARWSAHKREMNKKNKCDLYMDMNKYGLDDFIIEEIKRYSGKDIFTLDNYEEKYIKKYNTLIPNGYNKVLSQPFFGASREILLKYYNDVLKMSINMEKIKYEHAQKIEENDKVRRREKNKGKIRIKKPKNVYTTNITSIIDDDYNEELQILVNIKNIYKIYSSIKFSKKRRRNIYCLNIKHEGGINQYQFTKLFLIMEKKRKKAYDFLLNLVKDLCKAKNITNEISEYMIYGDKFIHFECIINDSPDTNQYSKFSIDDIKNKTLENYRYQNNLNQMKDKDIYRIYSLISNHKKRNMMTYTVIITSNEKEKRLSFGGKTIDINTSYNLALDFVRRLCALKNITNNIEEFETTTSNGIFKQFKCNVKEKTKEGYEYQDRIDFFNTSEILRFFSRRTYCKKRNFYSYTITIHYIESGRPKSIKTYSFGGQAMEEDIAYNNAISFVRKLLKTKNIEDNINETQQDEGKKFVWEK